uniref:Class III homeodomain-leucine zipper protein n=1 Tax=Nitella mirabilis TaxID=231897 RepID=A0A173GNX0_9VIRI|nr:class III homeodomain-leucine zipper protein [Nitella mirabilis]
MDSGKYVRYTNEQVEALERVYNECPKPSSARRSQLLQEYPILANIEPKQIKVWFQNRRCREKQRKEATRLINTNAKLAALNKLLMEENERLMKQSSELSLENQMLRQELSKMRPQPPPTSNDDHHHLALGDHPWHVQLSRKVVEGLDVTSPLMMSTIQQQQHQLRSVVHDDASTLSRSISATSLSLRADDASTTVGDSSSEVVVPSVVGGGGTSVLHIPSSNSRGGGGGDNHSGLLQMAGEMMNDFLAKATGTAVDWANMPGIKTGPDTFEMVFILRGGPGIASRACGLVLMEPARVANALKNRSRWLRECRKSEVLEEFRTVEGGTIEFVYTQMFAPTTLAPPRDFCTLRYTTLMEDGCIVICERSMGGMNGGENLGPVPSFVRAEMYPSGYFIRPYEGNTIIHIVDHMDLKAFAVPEVVRPLYESSAALAQRQTMEALRFLRRTASELNLDSPRSGSTCPQNLAWRVFAERIARGFNEAVNGFADDGWAPLMGDGLDDVSVAARPLSTCRHSASGGISGASETVRAAEGGVLCAKASMLLQFVPPSLLIKYLREHRSEWVPDDMELSSAAMMRVNVSSPFLTPQAARNGDSLIAPMDHVPLGEEFLEILKLANQTCVQEQGLIPRQTLNLQLCSGMNDPAVAAIAQLVFAHVDAASSADAVPLLPSGFRVIPIDAGPVGAEGRPQSRTLDLAASLDMRDTTNRDVVDGLGAGVCCRSVLTMTFQFSYKPHSEEDMAAIARQYVRSVVNYVQRVAMALAPPPPSRPLSQPEMMALAQNMVRSYRLYLDLDLTRLDSTGMEDALKAVWMHTEAIVCCSWKPSPEFIFANRAGLEMLETTLNGLSDLPCEKILNDDMRKSIFDAFSDAVRSGYCYLPPGVWASTSGKAVGYERAVAWKVVDSDGQLQCVAISFVHYAPL